MARGLLEREAELAALSAALDGARSGSGSLVLVEGAAGLGKTSLLRDAEHRAAEAGIDVVRGRGTPLERSIPFGVARQLFERRVARDDGERLLTGAAAPAAAALGGPAAALAGGMDEELEVLHGLYWLTANLSDEHPLLLVVDDLHWADVPSLRFLAYLAPRLDELQVAVVAATRTGEPDAPSALLTELAAAASRDLLRLAALSGDAVAELVRARQPGADDEFCRACALLDDGERALDLLRDAADVLEGSPIVLERARALVDRGALLRRMGRARDARDPLRTAIDLLRPTSAQVLRERAESELAAAGGRPRRAALSGVESLTPSERRVAELAAAGRSNPDIARDLFISRKTVEYHLGGAYRKLGITSREELAAVLHEAAA